MSGLIQEGDKQRCRFSAGNQAHRLGRCWLSSSAGAFVFRNEPHCEYVRETIDKLIWASRIKRLVLLETLCHPPSEYQRIETGPDERAARFLIDEENRARSPLCYQNRGTIGDDGIYQRPGSCWTINVYRRIYKQLSDPPAINQAEGILLY